MAIRRGGIGNPISGFGGGVTTALFWLAVLGAGGYGVYWCVGALKEHADEENEKNAPKSAAAFKREGRKEASGRSSGAPQAAPREAKPELDRAAAEVNLLILAREAARLKQDTSSAADHARTLTAARQRFANLAQGESIVPEVLDVNDEVLGIEDVDFSRIQPADAARRINQAIARIPAGSFLKVRVRRGNPRDVILYFGSTAGTGATLANKGYVKISNAFALEIQKNILALPPEQITDYEKKQIEKILGIGEATDEEYAMLQRRLSGAITDAKLSGGVRDTFDKQIEKLTEMLPKAPVPEAIVMKDGRRFTGKLLQDTPAAVSVRTMVGDITVPKDEVEHLITVDEVRNEFRSKYAAGAKFREALVQLLIWTQEMGMPVHRELVAYTILQKVPNDPFARNAAGYVQMDGAWTLKSSIAAGAPIPEKKAETKDDIRRELENMGFVLRNNKWYSKVTWATGIDSLYKPSPIKAGLNGTSIMDWHEEDTLIYRLDEKPRKLGPTNMKFIAPTGAQGLAAILVEAPGEIVECHVRASGAIIAEKPGVRLECYLTPDGGRSETLYDITKQDNSTFHDVTRMVRGKTRFTVTARMNTIQDKFQTYARFLTSNKDSAQVFWVKGIVLKPASEFDRVWAQAR